MDFKHNDDSEEGTSMNASHHQNNDGTSTIINNLNRIPSNLKYWNIAAAIFQWASAAALFYLSSQADTDWPLYTNYPITLDERSEETSDTFGIPGPDEIASYSVTWYSAVFIALSAIDHTACVMFCDTYEYYLARHQNPIRWAEYALSASLMRVMIAQLSGVTDIHLLFMIFSAAATTMMVGGALHESVNAVARADGNVNQNWFPFLSAWLPQLSSWLVIFSYFLKAVSEADPPNFVWAIVFILFVLDGTFALLFWLQWAKIGPFADYIKGEKAFIILSFTAKALLAWINYGGGSR